MHEDIMAALLARAVSACSQLGGKAAVRMDDPAEDQPEIGPGGLVLLSDEGTKALPAEFGAGAAVYDVDHAAEFVCLAASRARAASLRQSISAALLNDRTLGGIADSLTIGNGDYSLEGGDGTVPVHGFSIAVNVMATATNPMN
jgi:hypothetical protein